MHNFNRIDLANGISMYEDIYNDNDKIMEMISRPSVEWNLSTPTENTNIEIKKYRELSKYAYSFNPAGNNNKDIALEVSRIFAPAIGCVKDFVVDNTAISWYNDIEIIKYEVGNYMDEHSDNALNKKIKFSVFYYPNDDYEGGELVFIYKGITVKPKKNSLLIFQSSIENTHKVNPVTAGSKYVLTTFLL